jgi:glycosyltransferase involved in cell wall biosynthesis
LYQGKTVAVVIPAFNEEKLIGATLQSIPDFVDTIYAIDDGSTDKTYNIIQENSEKKHNIIPLKHLSNGGVGEAVISGYKESLKDQIDITIVMGGDDQMDPKYIPNLIEPIIEGRADYVKGNRLFTKGYTKGMSDLRKFGNSILTILTKMSSGYWNIMDPQNGYTAISLKALETMDLDLIYPRYGYLNDILVKLNIYGFKVLDVSIPAKYGNEKSKIRYGSYLFKVSYLLMKNFFWRLWTKYLFLSLNPIFFFYMAGIVLTPVGIALGIFSLYYKIVLNGDLFIRGVLSLLIFMIGIQFLLFAMLFDIQISNSDNGRNR